jgi:hypothetical protein
MPAILPDAPMNSGWPMDVGSITHTAAFGEIIDGTPFLRKI